MDAKLLMEKLKSGELLSDEQRRAAEVVKDIALECATAKLALEKIVSTCDSSKSCGNSELAIKIVRKIAAG